ncbi:MAG: MBOAT family protein [Alphaproteobacteria bacterium]|nr:MBOAT family protein [Alphaproteobacteria bacterium]
MTFNSLEFLVFLPVVVGLFFALPHRWRGPWILVASLVFYGWWSLGYLALLVGTATVDWFVALRLAATEDVGRRRAWLLASVGSNLGVLFLFKYADLFADTAGWLAGLLGSRWHPGHTGLVLPVGISFYTFQSLAYTVDVYRGQLRPVGPWWRFLLYVAYFPQLVAGPIERASRLLPQLERPVTFDWDRAASGLRLAMWGLCKKVVVADRLGEIVDLVYADPRGFGGFGLTVGTVFFGWQVYCDFSGYSDIARGVARLMGVDLMVNFQQPYLSRSMSELWLRWHVSMTSWFRDYVFVPLGGAKVSQPRWVLNMFALFVASGLWHGASWSFALWGAIHATIVVTEQLTAERRKRLRAALGLTRVPWLVAGWQWVVTLVLWNLTLPFFRASSLSDAVYVLTHALTGWRAAGNLAGLVIVFGRLHIDGFLFVCFLVALPVVELVEYGFRARSIRERVATWPTPIRWTLDWGLVLITLALGAFNDAPFVYFQF